MAAQLRLVASSVERIRMISRWMNGLRRYSMIFRRMWLFGIVLSFLLYAALLESGLLASPLLLQALAPPQESAFSWIGGKDCAMKPTLFRDFNNCILSSTAHNGAARNTFFQDTLQLFGKLELL